jgi:flagellar biosynthetic protein FliQ
MNDNQVIHLGLQAMTMAAKLSAPILVTALVIGFAISLFQSVTQIQEATLSFVPKAVGVGIALLASGNWMLHELITFTTGLFDQIPQMLGTG